MEDCIHAFKFSHAVTSVCQKGKRVRVFGDRGKILKI